jgi:hypothetical protein
MNVRILSKVVVACFVALSLIACTSSPPSERGYPAQITGIGESPNYPLRVGPFQRANIIAYAPSLKDISIGYALYEPDRQASSAIYLYPLGAPERSDQDIIMRHYRKLKASIERMHPGARILEESRATVRQEEKTIEGLKAVFGYREALFGLKQNLASEIYLFRQNDRFVKFRHTYPLDQQGVVKDDLKLLMETLKWGDRAPSTIPGSAI